MRSKEEWENELGNESRARGRVCQRLKKKLLSLKL